METKKDHDPLMSIHQSQNPKDEEEKCSFFNSRKNLKEEKKLVKEKIIFEKKNFNFSTNQFCFGDSVFYSGLTRKLRDDLYGNYKPPEKRRGKKSSSRSKGDLFHRQIFHAFCCSEKCVCKETFGLRKKPASLRKGCEAEKRIESLEKFLDDNLLEIVDCEVPVRWRRTRTATLLDAVAVSKVNPNNLFVLEFKTGYHCSVRGRASTDDKTGLMKDAAKHIPNTPLNQHMLQLWFGMEALKRRFRNEMRVADGILIYFYGNTVDKTYRFRKDWKHGDMEEIKKRFKA